MPNESKLNLKQGLAVLTDPSVKKIAIANPQHAPYGRAAVAALHTAKLYDQLSSKFVMGENISQTAQFVQSGNADIGIIALSLAKGPAMSNAGRYYVIPSDTYPPIQQAAVVLKSAKDQAAARQFLDFVKSHTGSEVLARYGFDGEAVQKNKAKFQGFAGFKASRLKASTKATPNSWSTGGECAVLPRSL